MSRCAICGRELITGDIHWEQGLCNQCWNVYRHEKTPINQYVDMLYKEIYELQNENLKQQLAEKDHRIAVLERALINLAKNVKLGDPEVIKLIYITIAEDELEEESK